MKLPSIISKSQLFPGQYVARCGGGIAYRIWRERMLCCNWRAQRIEDGVPVKRYISARTLKSMAEIIRQQ